MDGPIDALHNNYNCQLRYPEEFKIEAVRQITDRGYPVVDVSRRLGVDLPISNERRALYKALRTGHQEVVPDNLYHALIA